MKKEVIMCDGCKRILQRTGDIFKIYVKTDEFWNGVDKTELVERLDFCYKCAIELKETLKKLVERLEKGGSQ